MHYGNTQPNPLESKVWLSMNGELKTYNKHTKQWGNTTSSSVPEEPEKPTSLYEFVDLGLPSGTLWATTNVGAEKPEDYGLYFAWGETLGYEGITTDRQFTLEEYKFGTEDALTKYNNVDGLTVLELEDDAAYQSDKTCRMPTKTEWRELLDNTTSTWETLNGVNGRRFTSTNGNSIFVPAAGLCYLGSIEDVGYNGSVWSSSLDESDSRYARYLDFAPDNVGVNYFDLRFIGFTVRAVKSIN